MVCGHGLSGGGYNGQQGLAAMQVLHAKRGDVAGGVYGYAEIQGEVRRQSSDTLSNVGEYTGS